MKVGIIGLPNVGKSTIFNALTNAHAVVASYPFTTIEPNIGVVAVPDERLKNIAKLLSINKTVPGNVKFLDIAGLIEGASKGEGLGNRFLSEIREVDALIHILRGFKNEDIPYSTGNIDPLNDISLVNIELILSDLEILERRALKLKKKAKSGDKKAKTELEIIIKAREGLEKDISVRFQKLNSEEKELLEGLDLLSYKPVIYVINVGDDWQGEKDRFLMLKEMIEKKEQSEAIIISGKFEAELFEIDGAEREMFLKDAGFSFSGLDLIAVAAYKLLGLITFFSTESDECKAWPVKKGTNAQEAAGKIHTDMAEGFIKAEIVHYEDLMRYKSLLAAREAGHYLIEGREYPVKDGDIILFKFRK
ncbi:MAG: redox-regulated ATPase YchF [Actinomycetia bacterium]|nr:redox-regulated ATPase YchF [Actinomycetes bacterium]